jgi:hypothetical protein
MSKRTRRTPFISVVLVWPLLLAQAEAAAEEGADLELEGDEVAAEMDDALESVELGSFQRVRACACVACHLSAPLPAFLLHVCPSVRLSVFNLSPLFACPLVLHSASAWAHRGRTSA